MGKIYQFDKFISDTKLGEFTVSNNVYLSENEVVTYADELVKDGENIFRVTMSVCPECEAEGNTSGMLIPAAMIESNGKMLFRKKCAKHGLIEDIYWHDASRLKKVIKYADNGRLLMNPDIKKPITKINCPLDCGLCVKHKSHTALANIVLTNRCPLSCWYCFFYAKEGEPIYEPSLTQIRNMCKNLRNERPVPPSVVQLTGGEPTIRDDLVDIIRVCKEEGFDYVQLNTYGKSLAYDPKLTRDVIEAGVNIIYMSFDGVSEKTNQKNYWEAPMAIDNVGNVGNCAVVLVPTVIGGVNDHELGDIIRFAAANLHAVHGVDFQPVSFIGRMPQGLRYKQRITIPKAIKLIEEQTDGQITRDDFFTIPCVAKINRFVEMLTSSKQYILSNHVACGAGTYVFVDGKKLLPLPQFFDVDGFLEYLGELTEEMEKSRVKVFGKAISTGKLLLKINSFLYKEKAPKNLDFGKLLTDAIMGKNGKGVERFHDHTLFIGMMHFMDLYNYDIDRVERCNIHYSMPNNTIVPFCTHNVFSSIYRDKVQREFSISAEEFKRKTGHDVFKDKWDIMPTEEEKKRIRQRYKRDINKFK